MVNCSGSTLLKYLFMVLHNDRNDKDENNINYWLYNKSRTTVFNVLYLLESFKNKVAQFLGNEGVYIIEKKKRKKETLFH